MSWDIYIQDFPKGAKSVEEIGKEFKPPSIGSRQEIISKIIQVVPFADFTEPTSGKIAGPGFSIEVNLVGDEELTGVALFVRGDGEIAIGMIAEIVQQLGLRAIAVPPGEFFKEASAANGFRLWREYRDRITRAS
jgi:hypothetical protein